MEVRKPGVEKLHQTDIGALPVSWEVCALGSISTLLNGRAYGLAEWEQSGTPVIRLQNLTGGDEYYYSNLRLADGKYCYRGDLLYMWSATFGPYIWQGEKAIYHYHIWKVVPKPNRSDRSFLYHKLSEITALKKATSANGGTMLHLTKREMESTLVAVPPLQEQEAIAKALSDADALIESLSLLLAKKRQIKQGAMQELLTGKKRLPRFSGAWGTASVGSVAEVDPENLPAGTNRDFFFNYVALEDVERGVLRSHSEQLFGSAPSRARRRLRHGDVLVGTVRPHLQSHLLFQKKAGEWVGSTGFAVVRSDGRLHPGYLFEHLFGAVVGRQIDALLTGSNYPAINSRDVRGLEIPLPSYEEQAAIFDVLSSMNDEIASLESKLAKAHDLKQGMMQALLTGRIRLVKPTSNVIPLPTRRAVTKPSRAQSAHNWQINEAVVIGVLAQRFGSERFPLPRKRRVKLMYLLHRHAEGQAQGYLKKAAGPYDPNIKYKGPEQIALKNGYVRALRNETYEGFVAGDQIDQAQRYFDQWYGAATLEWLEQFHYRKTDDLELLATVDMAMVDLAANGEAAGVTNVKRVIAAHPEWLPKLSRELFSDERIAAAIAECQTLFGG